MTKIFNGRNIMLFVATILVIALLVATILVSIEPKPDYKGVLEKDDVIKSQSVVYSLETENAFKSDVSRFLENMLASFFNTMQGFEGTELTIKNSYAVSNPLLNIFSRSAIPSDKLLAFGKYLKDMNSDDAVMDIWLFFIKIEENSDGTFSGRFATPTELAVTLTGEVDFGYAVNDIVSKTALTAEEVGRMIYELLYSFGDVEQQELLSSVGRASFVNLFVSITTVYEAYVEFSLVGGTLSDARTLGELAYQMGAELDDLIDEVGVATILGAVYLNKDVAIDNSKLTEFLASNGVDTSTLADVNDVNEALQAGVTLAEFVVYFLRTTLIEAGNQPFEYLALYYAGEKENAEEYLYMHHLTLARAIKKGCDKAMEEGVLIKNRESLVNALANFKLTSEEISSDLYDGRLQEIKSYFNGFLDAIYALANDYSSVASVEDLASLSQADYQELKNLSDFMVDFNYNELTTGTDELLSTLFVNVAFNLFSEIAEEALGEVTK